MGWARQLHKLGDVGVIEKIGEVTEDIKFCSQVVLDVTVWSQFTETFWKVLLVQAAHQLLGMGHLSDANKLLCHTQTAEHYSSCPSQCYWCQSGAI